MGTSEGVIWEPTGKLRIVRRWFRADRLQQEYLAANLGPGSDRITEWWDVPIVSGREERRGYSRSA